jgi:phytanoyl-CoA hydroxylase
LQFSRYFIEEDAVDENGNLTREKQKAVNKIGHGECTSG